jgi:succinylglutamate desuccinylase
MSQTLQNTPTQQDAVDFGALPYGPEGPPRVLGRHGPEGGPTLVCVAGLHGNEPMGVIGLARALSRLSPLEGMLRGRVIGLAGNRKALVEDRRFIDHDLNRAWFADRVEALRATHSPLADEDRELVELDREVEPLLEGGGPVYLLDLHTTSGPGPAFSVVEDTLANRTFGLSFPVPMVLGFEEEVGGTMSNYLCDRGVIGVGFEAGQHREPVSAERADAAVWIALEASGVLSPGSPEVAEARRRLAADTAELPPIVEVRYRHAISNSDRFRMNPGHRTFQTVRRGQRLGRDRSGEVTSPADGLLLMPLYQKLGDDGFFVVRRVRKAWLTLSAAMRRYRLERFLHLLPGVRKHPERVGAFIVNRRIARFLTLQLFHLLGFQRVGPVGRYVVLHRRAHDDGA